MKITGKGNIFQIAVPGLFVILFLAVYGCSDKPSKPAPRPAVQPAVKTVQEKNDVLKAMEAMQETVQEGYVYDKRHRRDPFVPLIV